VSFEGASGQLELARFSDSRRWLQSRFVSFQDTQLSLLTHLNAATLRVSHPVQIWLRHDCCKCLSSLDRTATLGRYNNITNTSRSGVLCRWQVDNLLTTANQAKPPGYRPAKAWKF